MLDKFSSVIFIDESRDVEPSCMFTDCFLVRFEPLHDIFKGCFIVCGDVKQDLNAIMIRHSLQMTLHLFCGLYLGHESIIHDNTQ